MDTLVTVLQSHIAELIGGLLIGMAATSLLFFNGRIAGVSGIIGGILTVPLRMDQGWRISFLAGLLVAGFAFSKIDPYAFGPDPLVRPFWVCALGVFLVGLGTGLANGCTSGHGICGLARRSIRSLVATLLFLGAAILTARLCTR